MEPGHHWIPREICAAILELLSPENRVKKKVTKFADDTKFITIVKMVHEFCGEIAKNLAKESDWQKKWQMKLSRFETQVNAK